MADKSDKAPGLTDQINELETLVEKKSMQSRVSVVGDRVIPILDEVVTSGSKGRDIESGGNNEYDDGRYNEIIEKVEEKLSLELDEIVNLLKGNLKDSILNELQDQIKKDTNTDSKE